MAAKPEADATAKAAAPKSKKMLVIVGAVLVLALGGGGAFYFMSKNSAAEGDASHAVASKPAAPKTPPVYLPLDNMVVNLADPGGERVTQIGITLEVRDAKASDAVKVYLPAIRSGVLMLISQRTADELLSQEGKEKLAAAILREASIPFGGGDEEEEDTTNTKKKKRRAVVEVEYPVVGVLFSSFIVQ